MTPIPVLPEGAKREDYWVFDVAGTEWMYVLQSLLKRYVEAKVEDMPVITFTTKESQVFLLKKSYLPAELVMKATGFSSEWLASGQPIKLRIKAKPDLPEPTVDYWGTA